MSEPETGGPRGQLAPILVMLAGVLAWLWPIGLGGQIPVGGDATQFSMGLMAFLRGSLLSGRLPLWNDLWGFGFPGLAESQMGVFYPPHLLLYGSLSTETAYCLSLVLHTLWGALGANWAARRFGCSPTGAALSGFAWATCGFFLIHLPHQWGYTVGSWMPWAWGLAWQVSRGEGSRRTPWLLAAVLALQTLPGHFQLAFVTEVGVLVLALVGGGRSIGRRVSVLLALAGMIPLAVMQLWPTFQLAQLSGGTRDFIYLSGFAATPLHLINFVAPGLFHRSPLWRPVVWDTFHTSPEEVLGSIGLVPLFLALGAIVRSGRSDPGVRSLAIVAGLTLVLSFGPYVPGFGALIQLPGFSFFRAPARWGLATSLALSILAGRGFDGLFSWSKPGRGLRRFVVASLIAIVVVVGGFELALASSKGNDLASVASGFDRILKILPWADQPESKSFRAVMAEAFRPQTDLRTQSALARQGDNPTLAHGPTLAGDRMGLYTQELGETGALLVAIWIVSLRLKGPRALAGSLLILTFLDGLIQARHRPFDLGPARPLIAQSPVMTRLSQDPRGTRTLDPAQNLFMVAGASPVSSYRTLDLPGPGGLLQIARGPLSDSRVTEALQIAGVGVRVLDPSADKIGQPSLAINEWSSPRISTIHDPALAGWLLGADLVSSRRLEHFGLLRPLRTPSQAWLLPSKGLKEADGMANPLVLLEKFRAATPLASKSDVPERAEVEVRVTDRVASMVVLSKTFDPGWQAWWSSPSGEIRPAKVEKVLGGWQGVLVPEPGQWTLHLDYPGRGVWVGLVVSAIAWIVWLVMTLRINRNRVESESEGAS